MKNPFTMNPNWQYLLYAYVLFAVGFFFPVWNKYHNHLYYFAILIPYVITLSRDRLRYLLQSSIIRLAVVYIGMISASVLWASPPEPHKLPKYLLVFIQLTAFIALTTELKLQTKSFQDTVIKAVLASAMLWIPVTVIVFYHAHPWSGRLEGLERLQNPLAGATMYGMTALLCLYVIVQKDRFEPFWRILAGVCGALCIVYIALTQSRSPVLALLAAGTLHAALLGYRNLLLIIFGTCLAAGLAFYLGIISPDMVTSRGLSYRPEIWMQTLPTIMKHPWFGNGATFDQVYHLSSGLNFKSHTHSALMASLVFVGIVGTGILTGLIAQAVRYARRAENHIALSLLVYAIANLLINGYKLAGTPEIEWLYFWFPLALIAANEIKIRHPSTQDRV
ncbi:MAG TPA: O-antigen ligase family protein [Gammaproteobacteria bacterium]|nr:O-antigen ligase family protein [Gammaproteobacteria bacterium]